MYLLVQDVSLNFTFSFSSFSLKLLFLIVSLVWAVASLSYPVRGDEAPALLIPALGSAACVRVFVRGGVGGLGRPQPALLPLFTQPGPGAGWTHPSPSPPSTPQHNGKWGSGKIRETHTHSCHSLDLRESPFYYLKGPRREEGAGLSRQGERGVWLATAADFWMNKKKEKKRKEKELREELGLVVRFGKI